MNVFKYEMKQATRSIITWSLTYAVAVFAFLSATTLFLTESGPMKDMILKFPPMLRSAMNMDVDTFFSPVGFYSYIYIYIGLMAAIQAMSTGVMIISKENRMKTADFLMSKPKRRRAIFLQKLLAALCGLLICEVFFGATATLSINIQAESGFAVEPFALITLTFFFIQMIFLSIGIFLASVITKIKSPITITMGVTFGMFMVGMISAMAKNETLRYLSPLKYFDNNYIMINSAYETKYLIISVGIVAVLMIASFCIYVRKDIKALT